MCLKAGQPLHPRKQTLYVTSEVELVVGIGMSCAGMCYECNGLFVVIFGNFVKIRGDRKNRRLQSSLNNCRPNASARVFSSEEISAAREIVNRNSMLLDERSENWFLLGITFCLLFLVLKCD